MNVGDLLRITSCQKLLDQRVCNVFYYVVALWTGNVDLDAVAVVWLSVVQDQIQNLQASQVTNDTLYIENLDNPAETYLQSVGGGGERTSVVPVASFAAFPFRLYGADASTRSGWKRFAGVAEDQIDSGAFVAGVITAAAAVEAALIADIHDGSAPGTDFRIEPVIVGRNPDGTLNLAVANPIVDAIVQPRMTTQNSRKVGRGV